LIDAAGDLSVQVHPDDVYAMQNEGGYGKTEAWYILDAEPGASIIYGFKKNMSKEEFRRHIADGTLTDHLNVAPVKKDDVFFIPAGTVHAIGKGILLAEIQQSSNSTYRVYDYGRLGADGAPRPLHIEKAVDVADMSVSPAGSTSAGSPLIVDGCVRTTLVMCDYFTAERLDITKKTALTADRRSFISLLIISGSGSMNFKAEKMHFKKGDSIFVPAGFGTFEVAGKCSLIETKI